MLILVKSERQLKKREDSLGKVEFGKRQMGRLTDRRKLVGVEGGRACRKERLLREEELISRR